MKTPKPISRSGRFAGRPADEAARFTESISFDWRLWRHDLIGSRAHAAMLRRIGIFKPKEFRAVVCALDEIGAEIESGRFKWRLELEDVHMNLEAALTQRVAAGAKLHTGRSRNDQIALDLRLWLRDEIDGLNRDLRHMQRALLTLAHRHREVLLPGYTHLQRAQPVSVAHHLLAYLEMLERDRERMLDCRGRANVCPLGSGALAGSTLPLDRESVAVELGFVDARGRPRLSQNSMDAVADRDFAVEFCAAGALLSVHLSRLAEDLILWASTEFGFISISDAFTTGSSLMPQKRNPDVAELARGKTGRAVGNLVALLTLLKGLPMTYNRDLQEDKERLFDTADHARACLRAMAAMLAEVRFNAGACAAAVADPALLATDLVDELVLKGVPFRAAHHAVGVAIALAEKANKPLGQLTGRELEGVHPSLTTDLAQSLSARRSLARRRTAGSPSPAQLRRQFARWNRALLRSD